jgi:hypothetical protein
MAERRESQSFLWDTCKNVIEFASESEVMKVTRFSICGHLISDSVEITFSAYGWLECAMLSKCANPDCSEVLRYLHEGKIFCLSPTPEVEAVTGDLLPVLHERFWLCDECSKEMTVVWGGTEVKLVPLPEGGLRPVPNDGKIEWRRKRPRARASYTNREDQ